MSKTSAPAQVLDGLYAREVIATVEVREDRQVRLARLRGPQDVTLLEIRDFIPSTGLYGRGVTLPAEHAAEIALALTSFVASS